MTALLGVCGPHEGIPVDTLHDLNAEVVRFTPKPDVLSQMDYLDMCAANGLFVMTTFDKDSFPGIDWEAVNVYPSDGAWVAQATEQLEWYARAWRVKPWILGVWNEWDGTGYESSTNAADAVNIVAQLCREIFGDNQLIAHGSIVTGQPERLTELDWTHVNFAAMDEYTKTAPGHEHEPPGGSVLNLSQYRAVLPMRVGMVIPEIGLSSNQCAEDEQAAYCESVLSYARTLPDLALIDWFCFHGYNGWGLVDEHGNPKPAYEAYRRASMAPTTPPVDPPTEPPVEPPTGGTTPMALPTAVYERVWKAHLPDAEFHPTFGVEKFWMDHYKELGAVTDLTEYREGKIAYRTFVGGVIVWNDDTGASIA